MYRDPIQTFSQHTLIGKHTNDTDSITKTQKVLYYNVASTKVQSGTKNRPVQKQSRIRIIMNWLNTLLEKFDSWSTRLETKAMENYLSKSQNVADLENRMKTWQYANQDKRPFLRY